jgi:hypothetical protein
VSPPAGSRFNAKSISLPITYWEDKKSRSARDVT